MGTHETLILYLLIGAVVGAALWLAHGSTVGAGNLAALAGWITFWPFYAPSLFGQAALPSIGSAPGNSTDRLDAAQQRLRCALRRVEGIAEGSLGPHTALIDSMLPSFQQAQKRLADMEELLRSPELDLWQVDEALRLLRERGYDNSEARVRSLLARRRNIDRLKAMRDHTRDELERALLRLDEISSQVTLLRFADQPETQVAALLKDVASNVEDLTKAVLETHDVG